MRSFLHASRRHSILPPLLTSISNTASVIVHLISGTSLYNFSLFSQYRYMSLNEIEDPAIADVARVVSLKKSLMPIPEVVMAISARSKSMIFKSGKGVENYLKDGAPAIEIVEEDGIKKVKTNIIMNDVSGAKDNGIDEGRSSPKLNDIDLSLLRAVVNDRCKHQYRSMNEIYQLARLRISFDTFIAYVNSCDEYWTTETKKMRLKRSGETDQPPSDEVPGNVQDIPYITISEGDDIPADKLISALRNKVTPGPTNNWGGWGSQIQLPTEEDVYEILKYVPVHWCNLGNLNIPSHIKKRHIRVASSLQWFRRQPKYFEVRNVAGTLEIRRSVLLHTKEHDMTPLQALNYIRVRINSGELNNITSTSEMGSQSLAATNIYKFLVRVVPGYFVSPELIFMRYSKKNLQVTEMMQVAREHSTVFEILPYANHMPLIRRRTGSDSSRWIEDFNNDFESVKEEMTPLFALMGRSTVLWDRPEYLYVRLLQSEKVLVGGYANMLAIMKRHPKIFYVGERFFRRVDLSDPVYINEGEPIGNELAPRHVEENVYCGQRDLATIFHYVAPDEGHVNLAQLHEACSPAMRTTLPPHLVSILQVFPDLFNCVETAPGVFSIRKVKSKGNNSSNTGGGGAPMAVSFRISGIGGGQDSSASSFFPSLKSNAESTDAELGSAMLSDSGDVMTRAETVNAVRSLIPSCGVEIGQLNSWLSMSIKNNVERHFVSLQKMMTSNAAFSIDNKGFVKVI